jgi:hypothetical protein
MFLKDPIVITTQRLSTQEYIDQGYAVGINMGEVQQRVQEELEESAASAASDIQSVNITGLVSSPSLNLNGVYRATTRMHNDKVLFQKEDDPTKWLRFNTYRQWQITSNSSVDINDLLGWVYSVDVGLDHPSLVTKWNSSIPTTGTITCTAIARGGKRKTKKHKKNKTKRKINRKTKHKSV